MDFVLGVDLGTSYFKLGLFNRSGVLCGLGRVAVTKDFGDGTRCEIPIARFWSLLQQGLLQACRMADTKPDRIQAVAYASQANSFVLLDQNMATLTPIILWSDNRSQGLAGIQELFQTSEFLHDTGLGVACNHQFCVAKILWLQKYQPEIWSRAAHLMTLSDYFTFALTNHNVGDTGTAALLGLLNIHTLAWQRHIIDLGGVELSSPLRPGSVAGGLSPQGAAVLGLRAGIPYVLGSLDHHMAAIGAGLDHIADMSESTGTVLACLKSTAGFHPKKDICTGTGFLGKSYYQLTFDDNGASGLEWYQQHHAGQSSMADLQQQAGTVAIGSDGLVARPNAERYPNLDGFLHKTLNCNHGHFTRALLESTAASMVKLVQHLSAEKLPSRITATGGGAKSNLWLQIKADMLGIEYVVTATPEPACLGAAMLASSAAGWFDKPDNAAEKWINIAKIFKPVSENHEKYLQWYQALQYQPGV